MKLGGLVNNQVLRTRKYNPKNRVKKIFIEVDTREINVCFFTRNPVLKTNNKNNFSFGGGLRDPVYMVVREWDGNG